MSALDRSTRKVAGRAVRGGPIGACPSCGGHEFLVLVTDESNDLLCTGCEHRWHYSMGFVVSADPTGTPESSASSGRL
jgi:hypothetical protein